MSAVRSIEAGWEAPVGLGGDVSRDRLRAVPAGESTPASGRLVTHGAATVQQPACCDRSTTAAPGGRAVRGRYAATAATPVLEIRGAPILKASGTRLIAGTLAVVVLVVIALSLWLGGAGSARAAAPARAHAGMTRIVVRPGQTLWGIASAAAPAADPFQVIAQIAAANRLRGTTIEAGEVLWVPKG